MCVDAQRLGTLSTRSLAVRRVIVIGLVVFLSSAAAWASSPPGDGRLEAAKRYFRTAELARPGAPVRAEAYAKVEDLAKQILASDPGSADAHFLLFAAEGRRLLLDSGKPSVANLWKYRDVNKHLDRALELDPSHPNALAARGGILLDLPPVLGGDPEQAERLLQRAVDLNPTGLGTQVTLARALLLRGDRDGARQHLLLAAHYACLKHEAAPLMQAEDMLAKLTAGSP